MTTISRPFRLGALLLALGLLALPAPTAHGQSVRELREENQALRTELADLAAELEAAREEVVRLQELVAELMKKTESGGGQRVAPPPLPPEEVSIDESKPNASPRALLQALVTSYGEQLKDMERGAPGDRERRIFMSALERWAASQERDLRQPITWHVRITGAGVPIDRQRIRITLQAVDPKTGATLGAPFAGHLARTLATRLSRREARIDLEGVVVVRGTARPRVILNEERLEAGAFDFPTFIAPFAEFELAVDVQSLASPPPLSEESSASPGAGPETGVAGAGDADGG